MTHTTHTTRIAVATHRLPRPAGLSRFALVAGPVALIAYGGIRLLSERGTPGIGWTLGHLAMLAGVLLYIPVLGHLHRAVPESRRRAALIPLVAAGAGLAATAVQAAIDLIAGLMSADRPEMVEIFQQVKDVPGVEPVVYGVVPVLFFVGQLALVPFLAAPVRTRLFIGLALLLGTVLMALSLDFLSLGGLCFLIAFAPLLMAGRVTPLPRTN
ncbi:hypothetical protein [Streptomyces sp. NPDC051561]|uniref:hypothetical protein n=1 Tax=Streptomyces sp. NPDC051561 TaxID=3365658 RepID=UPI0037AE0522